MSIKYEPKHEGLFTGSNCWIGNHRSEFESLSATRSFQPYAEARLLCIRTTGAAHRKNSRSHRSILRALNHTTTS
jgi:hypothetical protein